MAKPTRIAACAKRRCAVAATAATVIVSNATENQRAATMRRRSPAPFMYAANTYVKASAASSSLRATRHGPRWLFARKLPIPRRHRKGLDSSRARVYSTFWLNVHEPLRARQRLRRPRRSNPASDRPTPSQESFPRDRCRQAVRDVAQRRLEASEGAGAGGAAEADAQRPGAPARAAGG